MAMLVDKSTPAVAALFDTIPHGKEVGREGQARPSYLNVTWTSPKSPTDQAGRAG